VFMAAPTFPMWLCRMLSSKVITGGFNSRVKEKDPKGTGCGNLAGASCNAR
jgi:hypothetical protein